MRTATVNLPTILTVGRIALIPVFLLVARDNPLLGVFFFLLAAATDFFDGYLARKSGQVTKLGILLDPIADKLLIISALVLLVDMVKISPGWRLSLLCVNFWSQRSGWLRFPKAS